MLDTNIYIYIYHSNFFFEKKKLWCLEGIGNWLNSRWVIFCKLIVNDLSFSFVEKWYTGFISNSMN